MGREPHCATVGDDYGYVFSHSPSKDDLVDSQWFHRKAEGFSPETDGAPSGDDQDDPVAQHCFLRDNFAELEFDDPPRLRADIDGENPLIGEHRAYLALSPMP
jgi:hypothetical protein